MAIVSLILGLCVWLYAQTLQSQKKTITVPFPLSASQQSPDLVAIDLQDQIPVEVTGLPSEMDIVNLENVDASASVDLTQYEDPGIHEYRVYFHQPSKYSQFKWVPPPSIMVTMEALLSIRRQPAVEATGEARTGLKFGAATVDPPYVTISGPKTAVNNVSDVKVQLDLTDVASGNSYRLNVLVLDKDGSPVRGVRVVPLVVNVTPILAQNSPTRTLLVSPNWIGQPESGFRVARVSIQPSQVTVQGDRAKIADRLTVETQPIDLSGLKASTTKIVDLILPPGVKPLGPRRITVRIRIEPVSEAPSSRVPPP